ncbi:universal stress protein [Synechococcus sp. UW179A]|uniref:universal stress protein n=1 Tax=Synechococcus sp. UW179A TaxID=2575510 RepID=UPI000E0E89B2|nr:universal stress protein [Synechococcus sp. UW179A]
MFKTVLFPIDQSDEALETVDKALELARRYGCRLVLLSVLQSERSQKHDHEAVVGRLDQTRERFEQAGFSCQEIERSGQTASVIGDVADELNVDVIVMGTGGVNLESDSGCMVARVLQLVSCPVLVVP